MFYRHLIYLIFLYFPYVIQAQVQDDSLAPLNRTDSISSKKLAALDSVPLKVNRPVDSLQAVANRIQSLQDSVSPDLSRYHQSLDSLTQKLSFKIDSLNQLKLPTGNYTRLRDSLNQLGPAKSVAQVKDRLKKAQSKVSEWEGKATKPLVNVEQKVNEKLSLMRREGGEDVNLLGNIDLPGANTPSMPGVDIPSSTGLDMPNQDVGLANSLPEAKLDGLPDLKQDVPGLGELGKINEGVGEVTQVTSQISGYSNDLKNIGSGNLDEVKQLPNTLEQEAVDAGGLVELQSQAKVVDEYKGILASGNDKEALKQQALQQAPKLAKNHFKGQEVALQEAMDKMSSLKQKYTQLENMEDLPKRAPNAMKGKPFVERIVPGITLQIQKKEDVWLDYNLAMGYRITGRLTAGLGWNERIGITSRFGFTSRERVYGPRTYVDFRIKKGFSARVDVEKMNTFIAPTAFNPNPPSDLDNYEWVWGVFVGIKKQYDFVKNVKGNFQILYNLYTDHNRSPYVSRFNVRFGFEFPLRKRVLKIQNDELDRDD